METESSVPLIYSPLAILNLFNNSISIPQTKKLIALRGVFQPGKGALYNDCYYDWLRDESSDALITIITPALIRNHLQANKTVTFNGFITRRVVNNGSRIEIQFTVTDFVEQTQSKYTDDDVKKIELLQAKADAGYRDVQSWLKEKIINEQPFKIGVIIGKTGIIDNDIKHQLRESIAYYNLTFHRTNLTSTAEIAAAIAELEKDDFDMIVVSRGGGENMEIFNKPALAEQAIGLKALFVTAIGHKDDNTLMQKVADKAFITPSEFGQFLNDTYNRTMEELQHSRAQLVEAVKKQLSAGYEKEIGNLQTQLKNVEALKQQSAADMEKVYQERQKTYDSQITAYQAQVTRLENKFSAIWIIAIAAVLLGFVIGYLLNRH